MAQLGVPGNLAELIFLHIRISLQDVQTIWGSTYDMLARILEQQQAICAVLAVDGAI